MSKVARLLVLAFLLVLQLHFTSAAEEDAITQEKNCDPSQQEEQTEREHEGVNEPQENAEHDPNDTENTNQQTETLEPNSQEQAETKSQEEPKIPDANQNAQNQPQDNHQDTDNTKERPPAVITINEFVSDPPIGGLEWVELFNTSIDLLSLENLFLEEGSGKRTALHGTIPPNGFFTMEKINGNLNNTGDLLLLKDTNGLILDSVSYGDFDDGNISDNAPVVTDPFSVARKVDGQDTNRDLIDFVITTNPTKGAQNNIIPIENLSQPSSVSMNDQKEQQDALPPSIPLPQSQQEPLTQENQNTAAPETNQEEIVIETKIKPLPKIIISEILPNPTGEDNGEWIELYNAGEDLVDLVGWILDDAEGGSKPYIIDAISIASGNFAILARSQTKLILNNEYDTVRLFSPDQTLKESVSYDTTIEGASYARFVDTWQWTTTPSPGWTNVKPPETNQIVEFQMASAEESENLSNLQKQKNDTPKSVAIKNIKTLQLGDFVQITGIILVEPGILGTQIMYIGDDEAGIQIYSYKKQWPLLSIGDTVSITGVISQTQNERKINTQQSSDIQILGHEAPPDPITLDDPLDESMEGRLVKTTGQVVEKRGFTLVLDNGIEPLEIYIKKSTGIDVSEFTSDGNLSVIGIVQKQHETYKILTRYKKDIEAGPIPTTTIQEQRVLSLEPVPSSSRRFFNLVGILSPLLIGLVYAVFRGRNQTAV